MTPIKVIPLSEMYTAVWGKQGEHNAVQLSYDLTGWENAWPDGGAAVAFRRADGKEYAHTFEREGNTLLIPIVDYDTEIPGSCAVVISWIENGNEARSVVIDGRVNASIVSLGKTPTSPENGLIEQLNAVAADADSSEMAAKEAKNAAEAAQTAAEAAKASAEAARDVARLYRESAYEYSRTSLNAKIAAEKAQKAAETAQQNAGNAANDAQDSATDAENYATDAKNYANAAQNSATAAQNSANNSASSAADAKTQATSAKNSANDAKAYAESAAASAELSEVDVFAIRVSVDDSAQYPGTVYKSDRSYDDIKAAIAAGKACILTDPDGRVFTFVDEYQHQTYGMRLRFLTANWNRIFEGTAADYTGLELKTWNIGTTGNASFTSSPAYAPNPNSITFRGAVSATYDGRKNVIVEIPKVIGLPETTAADALKLYYVDDSGVAAVVKLGAGLKIENGELRLNLSSGDGGAISITENADGSVTLNGVSFAEQADGTVLLENATFTAQADGSVLIQ